MKNAGQDVGAVSEQPIKIQEAKSIADPSLISRQTTASIYAGQTKQDK
jgi:hypothetical protein